MNFFVQMFERRFGFFHAIKCKSGIHSFKSEHGGWIELSAPDAKT